MNEEKLILLVQKYKCLWCHSDPEYKKAYAKLRAWHDIAMQLNSSETEVKNKWRYLRDTFKRKMQEINHPSGSGHKHIHWKFLEQMQFLNETSVSRSRIGNLPKTEEYDEEEYLEKTTQESVLQQLHEVDQKRHEDLMQRLQSMDKNIDKKSSIHLFLMSCVEDCEALPKEAQYRIRQKITNIIQEEILQNKP